MPTIRDVARRAGVGVGTASRFFNGGSISEEKKARVLAAIHELGYQPNEVARSLSTGRSRSVGLIIPDLLNPFFPSLIHGVEEVCKAARVMVILAHTGEDQALVPQLVRNLIRRGVDAIICAAGPVDPGLATVPLVLVDRVEGTSDFDSVASDHTLGGRLAAEHLLGAGHKNVLFLSGPIDNLGVQQRWEGFRDVMESHSLTPRRFVGDRLDFSTGYTLTKRHFPDSGATAVFASNDLMALGVMRALAEMGLRVPADVAVIGFDGIEISDYVTPALTTIAQPAQQLGRVAADMAMERAYQRYMGPPRAARLEPLLTVRASG